jgi:hypothetical protein
MFKRHPKQMPPSQPLAERDLQDPEKAQKEQLAEQNRKLADHITHIPYQQFFDKLAKETDDGVDLGDKIKASMKAGILPPVIKRDAIGSTRELYTLVKDIDGVDISVASKHGAVSGFEQVFEVTPTDPNQDPTEVIYNFTTGRSSDQVGAPLAALEEQNGFLTEIHSSLFPDGVE